MKYTEKTKISRNDYLRLVGLLTLASSHNRALQQIEKAAIEITGEFETGGHSGDEIWGFDQDADALLSRLGITVEDGDGEATN